MQNLAVVSDTVCAHVGGPDIFVDAGTTPTVDGVWLCQKHSYTPACANMPNMVAVSQTICAHMGDAELESNERDRKSLE